MATSIYPNKGEREEKRNFEELQNIMTKELKLLLSDLSDIWSKTMKDSPTLKSLEYFKSVSKDTLLKLLHNEEINCLLNQYHVVTTVNEKDGSDIEERLLKVIKRVSPRIKVVRGDGKGTFFEAEFVYEPPSELLLSIPIDTTQANEQNAKDHALLDGLMKKYRYFVSPLTVTRLLLNDEVRSLLGRCDTDPDDEKPFTRCSLFTKIKEMVEFRKITTTFSDTVEDGRCHRKKMIKRERTDYVEKEDESSD